jgi:2-polyprenyl-3-methyl-5-hydroxy-6-metoxy-1,4-benzoquinol methylase
MILNRLKNDGIPELKLNKLQKEMKTKVEEKINEKIYQFETVDKCTVCESSESELIGEKDRYGFYYPVRICKNCGLIYTSPRMNQAAYNLFYNDEYRKLYGGNETADNRFFINQYERGKQIHDFLLNNNLLNSEVKTVLEVGCGAGGILKYFKDKGMSVKGIDLGEEYVNFGKNNFNLDLESTTLKELSLSYKPDIIIYSHVLEHLLNLNEELNLIKKNCHEKTILYIEVPGVKYIHKNYEMNILKYFQNAHTYHFTLTTLHHLLKRNGFELLAGNEFVMSAFKLGNADNNFANDYHSVIEYLKKQENNRMFYMLTPHGATFTIKLSILKVLDLLGLRKMLRRIFKKYKN